MDKASVCRPPFIAQLSIFRVLWCTERSSRGSKRLTHRTVGRRRKRARTLASFGRSCKPRSAEEKNRSVVLIALRRLHKRVSCLAQEVPTRQTCRSAPPSVRTHAGSIFGVSQGPHLRPGILGELRSQFPNPFFCVGHLVAAFQLRGLFSRTASVTHFHPYLVRGAVVHVDWIDVRVQLQRQTVEWQGTRLAEDSEGKLEASLRNRRPEYT